MDEKTARLISDELAQAQNFMRQLREAASEVMLNLKHLETLLYRVMGDDDE